MQATERQAVLLKLALAVLETVAEGDRYIGSPAGPMYVAFMARGYSLEQFNQLMDGLVRAGLLTRLSHAFHITHKGLEFIAKARGRA